MKYQNHITVPVDSPIEVISNTTISPFLSKAKVRVAYVGINRNGSYISKEVLTEMGRNLPGCPVSGFYNTDTEDFEEHNKKIEIKNGEWNFIDETQIYGFVPTEAKVWFEKFTDDGFEHEYLCTECYLWTGIMPESRRIITEGNNHQSMELNEETLKGSWSKLDNADTEYFIINEAFISKLCILGADVEPCFEGANIEANFSYSEKENAAFTEFKLAIEKYTREGGPMEDTKVIETEVVEDKDEKVEDETPVVEEETKVEEELATEEETVENDETPAEEETPAAEEKEEDPKGNNVEYNLDEIQEYRELKAQYDALNTSFNAMKAEYESLIEFKKEAERKAKQEMIDSFYMLSDEDKNDVVSNIDNYSLEDIEAKLSVICVRNKVNFSLNEESTTEGATFTVPHQVIEDDPDTPDWIKALDAYKSNK